MAQSIKGSFGRTLTLFKVHFPSLRIERFQAQANYAPCPGVVRLPSGELELMVTGTYIVCEAYQQALETAIMFLERSTRSVGNFYNDSVGANRIPGHEAFYEDWARRKLAEYQERYMDFMEYTDESADV